MTQLITETILRRAKILFAGMAVLLVLLLGCTVALLLLMQRMNEKQDQLAASQVVVVEAAAEAAVAAIDAEASSHQTERVLAYLCVRFSNLSCPGVTTTTTTTPGG